MSSEIGKTLHASANRYTLVFNGKEVRCKLQKCGCSLIAICKYLGCQFATEGVVLMKGV